MMAIAGVVLIQHPLHLLLLKSSFSGTFVGAALSRGQMDRDFVRFSLYRYAPSFQPSAKDLVVARDSLDDAGENKD